jgi:RimJ/RimL family protein N-acetyltransferase
MFFGRLPEEDNVVGACSLEKRSESGLYAITYLTHPDFEGRRVATTLAAHAVNFAKKKPNITTLNAAVRGGSVDERVVQRLGFLYDWDVVDGGRRTNMYQLDTSK